MKRSCIFLLLLCCLLLLSACGEQTPDPGQEVPAEGIEQEEAAPEGEYSITEPYDFTPITEQPGWSHGNTDEKLAKCNIPKELLPEMSTKALIETIFNHPLIIVYCDINNLPVNGNHNVHMDYLSETFNAVPELFSRDDALTVMEDVYYLGRTERRQFANSVGYALLLELQARAEEAEADSIPEQL